MSKSGVITDIGYLATCAEGGLQSDIHPILDGAVAFEDGRIVWVGAKDALPTQYRVLRQTSASDKTLIPGLVDCHTHLAFGGWRADEFGMRI